MFAAVNSKNGMHQRRRRRRTWTMKEKPCVASPYHRCRELWMRLHSNSIFQNGAHSSSVIFYRINCKFFSKETLSPSNARYSNIFPPCFFLVKNYTLYVWCILIKVHRFSIMEFWTMKRTTRIQSPLSFLICYLHIPYYVKHLESNIRSTLHLTPTYPIPILSSTTHEPASRPIPASLSVPPRARACNFLIIPIVPAAAPATMARDTLFIRPRSLARSQNRAARAFFEPPSLFPAKTSG